VPFRLYSRKGFNGGGMVERRRVGTFLTLTVYSLILLVPITWMVLTAFKTPQELFRNRYGFPEVWRFENFAEAIRVARIPQYFMNTVIVVAVVFVFAVSLAAMAGYVLTRFSFRWRSGIRVFFIAGLTVPVQAVVVPIYSMAIRLGAVNNLFYLGLVNAAFSLPLCVLILSSFIQQIPAPVEESAIIDGCSRLQVLLYIVLPTIREGIISATVLVGLHAWNGLLLPLLLLSRDSVKTISIGMRSFFTQFGSSPTLLMAACLISMLPILLLYALLQERMIKGLTVGAVKG
jgi:raffinose/stachyose/melibiose transport system permease protein